MEKAWVYAVVGGCALLVAVLAARQFSGSVPEEKMPPHVDVAALSERGRGESGGWIARTDDDKPVPGGGAARDKASGSRFEHSAAGGSERDRGRGATSIYDASGRARGGTSVITSAPPSSARESDAIQARPSVQPAEVPFEGARSLSGRGAPSGRGREGSEQRQAVAEPGTEAASSEPDPDGLVLSLPFDNSTQPDKGDPNVVEQGVQIQPGEGANFALDSQFVVPNGGNISGEAGTVSFWVQPGWVGGEANDASLVQLRNQNVWENRLQIFKNGRYLRFLLTDSAGIESNIGATIDAWQPGDWHHVTATWGDGMQSFYVDGKLIGQVSLQGQLDVRPGTPLYVGSDVPEGIPAANGTLSQFKVYNRPLGPDEVGQLATSRGR